MALVVFMNRFKRFALASLLAAAFATGCSELATKTPATITVPPRGFSAITSSVASNVPAHVQNYTYWNLGSYADGVPASWMAQWATWVETGASKYASAFHAAGGSHTVAYTDPNYLLITPTYIQPGTFAESAFGHGSNGVRSQRALYGGTEYYLLPNSSASQGGYQVVAQQIAASGGFDYIYADGVSSNLTESDSMMSPMPIEISTDSDYVNGMKQLLTTSPLPTIANGYENGNPLQEEEYVGAPNIAGVFGEDCFTTNTRKATDYYWVEQANALIYTTSHARYAFCGGRGNFTDTRAFRTYYLASWWLTYDPRYSVSLEEFASYGTVYLFAEQLIVPASPTASASDVRQLKWYTGAYVRRFDACYYNRVLWGACAAIVNPSSTASAAIPKFPVAYHHSLALDNNNLFEGGQASLSATVPTVLGPASAVILFQ